MLGRFDLVDHASILMFHKYVGLFTGCRLANVHMDHTLSIPCLLRTCEKLAIGGFGKVPQNMPDVLHSFFRSISFNGYATD